MKNSFKIYNASAGSGKTFTLVKEYLSILFTSPKQDRYKNILAITFTNKAVGEMKSRIIESLAEFSKTEVNPENNPLLKVIAEETQLPPELIRKKSTEILKSIIHNYAAFEISTIDGFTHRVLRTFARDLGIPMNFEVELSADEVLMEAVDSLIDRAGSDEKLTKVLVNYTLSKTDDDKSWDISRDLFNISKLLINENHQKPIQLLKDKNLEDFEKFGKKLRADIKTANETLNTSSDYFFEFIQDNGIDEKWFSRGSIPGYFRKIKKEGAIINYITAWAANIDSAALYNKSLDDSSKSLMDRLQPEIAALFATTKKAYFQIEFLTEIRKNLVQLSLLNEINREVEEIKKDRNLVLISEFNPKISEQVKDQPAPFIYERLGERYQHYFIDEFQDTSTMQWENLIPLIGHNLSTSEKNSSLSLVGDAKQSIYRWRGGRAEQFIDLSNQTTHPFQIEQEVVNLPDNYRSGSGIVNFNNNFFQYAASILSFPEYTELFKASAQKPKKGDFGYVKLNFVEADNREEEFEIYPEKILEIIEDLDSKGFHRKDICILTRRKNEGIAIAEFLGEHSVPVISSETLLISQSRKVQFIVNMLAFSMYPEDNKLKLQLFDFLSENYLPPEEAHKVLVQNLPENGTDFFKWLSVLGIEFKLEELKRLSLYEAVEYIIRSFSLVEKSDAHIQFFLDFVFETAQKTSNSLNDFLEKWEQKKDKLSIVVPETDNAVQIMTIHKSKGLEFPVVIYPFANSELQDTRNDNLWLDINSEDIPVAYVSASKKMLNWNEDTAQAYNELIYKNELDTLNVLYVACTRAAQQLYILSNYHKKAKSSPNISDLLTDYLRSAGKWNDQLEYEFGDPNTIIDSKSTENASVSNRRFYSSSTKNKAVHIVTRSGSLWDSKQQDAIEKGEIAHEILARINSREDLNEAVTWAINSGMITIDSKEEITKLISGIIEHPELKQYYSKEVKNFNEKEIITTDGQRLRPDRININGGLITIIDYKTGGFVDTHKKQVSNYAKALEKMGYEIDRSLLIYTNNPIIIKNV
ncbi:UvrD-helicase domain-containing protein [Gramella sp. MAR_2010_147]|uniref:UvrD-helicase domain-containing protein n=1 Tax=Gramella sp. MAR_2010_147 TaxID=1250205 RepID=UPI00087A698F|nr:UvrD-helicase domain-containing protein [Gramella sp. MAR_2010_147]SDS33817.1 ATP-dependent exoDNAse (exonuclease V) beta subunit (contains helicase and exonuclease domains) [Gramella sp. MAR_2010_147]